MTRRKATLIDLFAGCGGLSLGLEIAGFEPVFASEINEHARETYLTNRRHLRLVDGRDVVGDITEITKSTTALAGLAKRLKREFGEIDLVAGGPPCQGYSTRGIRSTFASVTRDETPANYLYRDMAKFVSAVGPRMFLFENVRGLLTARWNPRGEKGEIWRDVQSSFSKVKARCNGQLFHYHVATAVIRASDFGVPQNRPRVFLIGVREDVTDNRGNKIDAKTLFPPPSDQRAIDLKDLLGDLIDTRGERLGYSSTYTKPPLNAVQRSLRKSRNGRIRGEGAPITDQVYTNHSERVVERFNYLIHSDAPVPKHLSIKKFAQRALPARWSGRTPSITATSAPDDYVHFSRPRILTVREWARLQMFPDWYVFCGPRTTGGRRRAGDPSVGDWSRELPRYTQIGNAVAIPVATAIGKSLLKVLQR